MSHNPLHPQYQRALGRDGKFRIHRAGPQVKGDFYHFLLTMPWFRFFLVVILFYLVINMIFAGLYFATGNQITNTDPTSFTDAFFFSIQTMSTIGFGRMAPVGPIANLLVTIEVLVGLVTLAIITGLAFTRFSKPTARVIFSDVAVVTQFNGKPALMFRMANQRANEIVEASISASLWQRELTKEGEKFARFYELKFVRSTSPIFNMTWTAIHVIDQDSPLYGKSPETVHNFELIVTLSGIDSTFSQPIHARTSYVNQEIVWNSRFVDIISDLSDGRRSVDLTHFHEVEPQAL